LEGAKRTLQLLQHKASRHIHRVATDKIRKAQTPRNRSSAYYKTCKRSFHHSVQLAQHLKAAPHRREKARQEAEEKNYGCTLCGLTFTKKHGYDGHKIGKKQIDKVKWQREQEVISQLNKSNCLIIQHSKILPFSTLVHYWRHSTSRHCLDYCVNILHPQW